MVYLPELPTFCRTNICENKQSKNMVILVVSSRPLRICVCLQVADVVLLNISRLNIRLALYVFDGLIVITIYSLH